MGTERRSQSAGSRGAGNEDGTESDFREARRPCWLLPLAPRRCHFPFRFSFVAVVSRRPTLGLGVLSSEGVTVKAV